jgi:vacuolar-type H+-ATPase subunit H
MDMMMGPMGPPSMDPRDPRMSDPRMSDPRMSDPRMSDPRMSDPRMSDPRGRPEPPTARGPEANLPGNTGRFDSQISFDQTEGDRAQDMFRVSMDSSWYSMVEEIKEGEIDVVGILKQLNDRHDKLMTEARNTNREKMVTERNTYRETVLELEKVDDEIKELEEKIAELKEKKTTGLNEADIEAEIAIEDAIEVGQTEISKLNKEHTDLVHNIMLAEQTDNRDQIPGLL